MSGEWKSNALGLVSIALAFIAFINEEARFLTGVVATTAIIFYIINSFSNDIDEYEERIKKLEDKLIIQDQLVALKGDVEYLKKEVSRK